jgi:hypothetical protein
MRQGRGRRQPIGADGLVARGRLASYIRDRSWFETVPNARSESRGYLSRRAVEIGPFDG